MSRVLFSLYVSINIAIVLPQMGRFQGKENEVKIADRTSLFKANEAVLTFYLYFKSSPYFCPSVYASLTVSRNLIVLQQLFISLFSTSCPSPAFACVNFVPAVNGRAGRITEIIHAGGCLEVGGGRWSR